MPDISIKFYNPPVESDKTLQILRDVLLEGLDQGTLDPQLLLHRQDLLLLQSVLLLPRHGDDSTHFQPPHRQFGLSELPEQDVYAVSLAAEEHVVGDAQFDQLVGHDPEDEGKGAGHLRGVEVLADGAEDETLAQLAVEILD